MSVIRVAGLISLPLLATTLQVSARPAPTPTEERAPAPENQAPVPAAPQAHQRQDRPVLLLEIAPNTQVWDSCGLRMELDGPGQDHQPLESCFVQVRPVAAPMRAGSDCRLNSASNLHMQAAKSWLVARYPNAPPGV